MVLVVLLVVLLVALPVVSVVLQVVSVALQVVSVVPQVVSLAWAVSVAAFLVHRPPLLPWIPDHQKNVSKYNFRSVSWARVPSFPPVLPCVP